MYSFNYLLIITKMSKIEYTPIKLIFSEKFKDLIRSIIEWSFEDSR